MVVIREVRKDEYSEVALMHNCILELHAKLLPKLFKKTAAIEDLISEIGDYVKNGVIYVAELNGELVGYLAARETDIGGGLRRKRIKTLYFDAIYVTPAVRESSEQVAEKLYKKARKYARKKGVEVISYDFWEENKASAAFCQKRLEQSSAHKQIRQIIFI